MTEIKFGVFLRVVWLLTIFLLFLNLVYAATPGGPLTVNVTANETKAVAAAYNLTIGGGYIATLNLTVTAQDVKWKGIVGWITGKFTLDDSSGSTLFDWTLATVTGNVYMTRNSSTPTWSQIKCANTTILENENLHLNHTGAKDNISITFVNRTHLAFSVAGNSIPSNSCPTLRTYVNNVSHVDNNFTEIALFDGVNDASNGNVVYATKVEPRLVGFDGNSYDFQAIVPENGLSTWAGRTSYYLYVEIQ